MSGAAAVLEKPEEAKVEQVQQGPVITVKAPATEPKKALSIKERLFGGNHAQPEKSKRGRPPKKAKVTLMFDMLPTLGAGLVVTFIRDKLPKKYQPCAPTKAEAVAILTPLFSELSRYFDVTGQISETAANLINCMIAILAYGARSYTTYVDIKNSTETDERYEQQKQEQEPASHSGRSDKEDVSSTTKDGKPVSGIAARLFAGQGTEDQSQDARTGGRDGYVHEPGRRGESPGFDGSSLNSDGDVGSESRDAIVFNDFVARANQARLERNARRR